MTKENTYYFIDSTQRVFKAFVLFRVDRATCVISKQAEFESLEQAEQAKELMDTLLFDYTVDYNKMVSIRIMKEDGKQVDCFYHTIGDLNPYSLEAEDIKQMILKHKRKYKKYNLEYNTYIIFTH